MKINLILKEQRATSDAKTRCMTKEKNQVPLEAKFLASRGVTPPRIVTHPACAVEGNLRSNREERQNGEFSLQGF